MADEVDRAQLVEALQLKAALARIRRDAPPKGGAKQGLQTQKQCEDCGEDIEAARLEALPTATRCIGCQAAAERRERNGVYA